MKISFTLLPKSEVAYLHTEEDVASALNTMRERGFQAVPVIDDQGHYTGTICEGDFLRTLILDYKMNLNAMHRARVKSLKMKWDYKPVSIDADIYELDEAIINQNFVPIVDDRNVFIGIVTRREIIKALIHDRRKREAAASEEKQES